MAPFEKNSVAAKLQLPIPMLCDSGITEEQLDTLYEILSALQLADEEIAGAIVEIVAAAAVKRRYNTDPIPPEISDGAEIKFKSWRTYAQSWLTQHVSADDTEEEDLLPEDSSCRALEKRLDSILSWFDLNKAELVIREGKRKNEEKAITCAVADLFDYLLDCFTPQMPRRGRASNSIFLISSGQASCIRNLLRSALYSIKCHTKISQEKIVSRLQRFDKLSLKGYDAKILDIYCEIPQFHPTTLDIVNYIDLNCRPKWTPQQKLQFASGVEFDYQKKIRPNLIALEMRELEKRNMLTPDSFGSDPVVLSEKEVKRRTECLEAMDRMEQIKNW